MNIYYFHPLPLSYSSGLTIQVIQDYKSLAKHGHRILLFGTYEDEKALQVILDDIKNHPITIYRRRGHNQLNRGLLKGAMLIRMLLDASEKVVVTRNINKMAEVLAWSPLMRRCGFFWERHEDAIPYLIESKSWWRTKKEKFRMTRLLRKIDGLILTNYSQEPLFHQEFANLPKSIVLPNGVNISRFEQAKAKNDSYILTYTGQFTQWKNVELLFQALALLDSRYRLRIAGGKGDEASRQWIEQTAQHFGVSGRIDYLGLVPPAELPSKVLNGSAALLLPLGDNLESRYFTSPMKLFEYMATSIPVIAVDYPSIRGITGQDTVYLSANEPQAFANTIETALNDSQQKQRIDAMNACVQQYSFEARAKALNTFLSRERVGNRT